MPRVWFEKVTRLPGLRRFGKAQLGADLSDPAPRERFGAFAAVLGPDAHVLEVGTMQAVEGTSTHHREMFPGVPRENYLMADIGDGRDVDWVADVQRLPEDWTARFDAFVAVAVFEHVQRPWIAAREIERILKPGGRCYVSTHQTYPLHAHPCDYFRFSTDALALIFEDAGIVVEDVAYEHRTSIHLPDALVPEGQAKLRYERFWNRTQPSYLVVHLHGRKRGSRGPG